MEIWKKICEKKNLITTVIGLIACSALIFVYLPIEILNALPATGGDTGSHFWPLKTLVEHALPNFHIKVWNPGNLGGEPQLVHYFPLPFIIMAVLSIFMPLGTAFNIGTMLPVGLFPICVYFCLKLFKLKSPIPLLAAAFTLSYLYNESFSMWGGNTLSTLAGQFAHVYAFDFFLIGLGVLSWELRKPRLPLLSGLLFAAVLTSHFYVGLLLPFVYLAFLFFEKTLGFKHRLKHLLISGVLANLLSAWFVIPMLDNSKWTTAYAFKWYSQNLMNEIFPKVFWPFIALTAVGSVFFLLMSFYRKLNEEEWRVSMPLWFIIVCSSMAMFFIFPKVGLVDIRALPQVQMAICIIAAIFVGLFLNRHVPERFVGLVSLIFVFASIWWASYQVKNFPHWNKWNYSGWQAKPSYPDLEKMYDLIRGDFSQGRIAYENNQVANSAGTIRVFEMLPYFANRSTTESVYHQSTIYSPYAFYFQSLISLTPSCPFSQFPCTRYDANRTADYMDLLGISQIVAMTNEVTVQLDQAPHLKKLGKFGQFDLYEKKTATSLVDVVQKPINFSTTEDYKNEFYLWFTKYKPGDNLMVDATKINDEDRAKLQEVTVESSENCTANVIVNFDKLDLQTTCPGKLHLLKFAFHSAWKSLNGEKLYLMSPAYMGIIPEKNDTQLVWGDRPLWNISAAVSWLTFVAMAIWAVIYYRRKK